MKKKILILGGTQEANEIARYHYAKGHDVTTSLAGRTRNPLPVPGNIRTGGFGGVEGLSNYLSKNQFDLLIDATHPYARQISNNALNASRQAKIPLQRIDRPAWQKKPGDQWMNAQSLEAATELIPVGAKVFLALGSQHIMPFTSREDVEFVIRLVDPPGAPLPFKHYELILGNPGPDVGTEEAILQEHAITHLVCRNSGGAASYHKVAAARQLKLPVIMIDRADADHSLKPVRACLPNKL